MKQITAASIIALAAVLGAAPLAAQSAGPVYSLPPSATPTPSDVQGPVDVQNGVPLRPRAIPTASPTPTAAPSRAPAPQPVLQLPRPAASPTPSRAQPAPTRAPVSPVQTQAAPQATTHPGLNPPLGPVPIPTPTSSPTVAAQPGFSPNVAAAPATTPAEAGGSSWSWLLGGLLVLAGAGGAAFAWRRRREAFVEPAPIEPPLARAPAPPPPTPAPAADPTATAPLVLEAQALRLSRSMLFATLSYRLQVTNRGSRPLEDIRLGGDLVTAHGRLPAEKQLADPAVPLAVLERIPRLEPGQSHTVAGDLRLPVGEIRPIPQGSAVLYVPLLRMRAEAAGVAPLARTFVVGLQPSGVAGRLQPFRLDEMPQTYTLITQRALD